ncbi:DUF2917 domain-containing protein [Herbaspirillum sp. LeCh32-8]|uniref:DUF2917 domain-containing protein n=1 Tax=Herbaspirillum sp. LeCh32-8 TaxID=2821356 RepID=UPI001AE32C78|nr:DUF2917 domain-containing protein [Herbaspirillum sp. LeCh32-8]MBP0598946.1 DUF2917 domain-containing protein [Herbaspirillum sp. LeCh32-8]
MQIPLSSEPGSLSLQEGATHALRLQSPVRVRVRTGLVWLTVEEGGADVWLSPGRDFDFHGRGLAVFEAVKGDAEFEVLPLPGLCSRLAHRLLRLLRPLRPAPADGCSRTGADGAVRITRLLPRGLIRWF